MEQEWKQEELAKQNSMNQSNLCNLFHNFLIMFVGDLYKTGRDALFLNILKVLQFYLWKNSEHQALFYKDGVYQNFLDKIFKYYPQQTVDFIYLTVISSPRIFISKKGNLGNILNLHSNVRKTYSNDFGSMKKLLEISHLHLDKRFKDILFDMPSYDLLISETLVEELPFWRLERIQEVLFQKNENPARYQYLLELFGLLSDSLHFRIANFKVKEKLMIALNPDTLLKIMSTDQSNLTLRRICMQLFDRIYVKLLDQNEQTKEHAVDYPNIFKFLISEMTILENLKNFQFSDEYEKVLYKTIFRLCNFISHFVDSRLTEYFPYFNYFEEIFNLIEKNNQSKGIEEIKSPVKKEDNLITIEFGNEKLNEQKKNLRKLLSILQKNIVLIIRPQAKQKELLSNFDRCININSGCYENDLGIENEKTLHKNFLMSYQNFKNEITIKNPEKNAYFKIINSSSKDVEQRDSVKNLCLFLLNQLRQNNWTYEKKRMRYKIMKCLSNIFFFCTLSMQTSFYQILTNNDYYTSIMDNIWVQLRKKVMFVKCVNNLNSLYFQTYEECLMLIKLHQFFCEDNNFKFKNWFRSDILPDSKKNRIIDLFEMFTNLSDSLNWSTNYQVNEIEDFPLYNKQHLVKLGIFIVQCINEVLAGPCKENQLEVFIRLFFYF